MNNEGDYLEFANDLRDQYNAMKEKLEREVSLLKEEIMYLENELYNRPELVYKTEQFYSNRPQVRMGVYVDYY